MSLRLAASLMAFCTFFSSRWISGYTENGIILHAQELDCEPTKRVLVEIRCLPRIWRSTLRDSCRSLRCHSRSCSCGVTRGLNTPNTLSIFRKYQPTSHPPPLQSSTPHADRHPDQHPQHSCNLPRSQNQNPKLPPTPIQAPAAPGSTSDPKTCKLLPTPLAPRPSQSAPACNDSTPLLAKIALPCFNPKKIQQQSTHFADEHSMSETKKLGIGAVRMLGTQKGNNHPPPWARRHESQLNSEASFLPFPSM
jgi:hypothetical protein